MLIAALMLLWIPYAFRLCEGKELEIGGFGTFSVVIDLKGERIPVFKGGRALKKVLNAEEDNE
jgi:nucleoid DNA-binding protein